MIFKRILVMLAFAILISACQSRSESMTEKTAATEQPADQSSPECVIEPPAEPGICTMDWNPVCGCDGKTYSNACMAKASGVSRMVPGECKKGDPR